MEGFPVVQGLNQWRTQLHEESHEHFQPFQKRTSDWLGHKCLSALSLPANAAAAGLGTAAMTTSAFTLGSLKVAIFAGTLGHIRPDFPIGVIWLGERTFHSLGQFFCNLHELGYDTVDLTYQVVNKGCQGLKCVAQALKIDRIVMPLLIAARDYCLKKLAKIGEGIDRSWKDECSIVDDKWTTIPVVEQLSAATKDTSFFKNGERSLGTWIAHVVLSIANIPANSSVAIAAAAVSCVTWPVFMGKSLFYAATDLSIPVPTTALYTSKVAVTSFGNALMNGGECIADMAEGIYKVVDTLRITTAIVKIAEVVFFIPLAIIS